MKVASIIKRYLPLACLCGSVLLWLISVAVSLSTNDAISEASHVSSKLTQRFDKLDGYAQSLLYSPEGSADWPELDELDEDMVVYKYVADTLHSWYNRFSVFNDDIAPKQIYPRLTSFQGALTSPLTGVGPKAALYMFGDNWYVAKSLTRGDVTIIEGLAVKTKDGFNDAIHIHGLSDLVPLSEDAGTVVSIHGQPVFKIVPQLTLSASGGSVNVYVLRLLAILLLIAAMLSYLVSRPTVAACAISLAVICGITLLSRLWEGAMANMGPLFSPTLYSGGRILDSFATVLIVNTSVFLACVVIFICRKAIADRLCKRWMSALLALFVVLMCGGVVYYTVYMLSDVMLNGSITMELLRLPSLSLYTLFLYFSLALLFVGLLLLLEVFLNILSRKLTMLTNTRIMLFALASSLIVSSIVIRNNSIKDTAKTRLWAEMLSMDRNMDLEMQLLEMESALGSDSIVAAMMALDNPAAVSRRLETMYFGQMAREYNVRATVFGEDLSPAQYVMSLNDPEPLEEGSRFLYENNPLYGSKYVGIFTYPQALSYLLLEITPRSEFESASDFPKSFHTSSSLSIPPYYSYARYYDSKLCSFRGSFAYPTLLDGMPGVTTQDGRFESDRYVHYIYRPDGREAVIVSRPQRRMMSIVVLMLVVVLLVYLMGILFIPRRKVILGRGISYFNTRIKYLVGGSLFLTLIVMVGVSVWFVYNRNERNLHNIMSARVSAVQIRLDDMCRTMTSAEEFTRPEFASELNEIARTSNTDIAIYTPDGRLFASTDRNLRDINPDNARIDARAYKSLVMEHQRYYIKKDSKLFMPRHEMYCQVSNAEGAIVALASVPYMERDYDFSRDAVFHAITMISIFLLLLFITVFLATSITQKMFSPLLEMSRKMHGGKPDQLEKIEYKGKDEISSIVEAYNAMVVDLQASTEQLAVAERDKAWSEMARQVAHEIKNPLTPIKLEIQRLMRLKQKNDPAWETRFDDAAQVVLEHIDILSQTANEFSTFAKLYSEEPVEIDLDKMLQDQIMLFTKDVELTYLGTPDAVIYGPKPQIIRVFVNLLSNAVQAVDGIADPKLLVTLRKSSAMNGWDISIEDNGPGVEEKNRPMLFTPNFTTKSSGTGLGLAISRSIVERCGGTIAYSRSFSLGGACFTVSLPLAPEPETNV